MDPERDTGEIKPVDPPRTETVEGLWTERQILHELRSIRSRLEVLIVWFIVLPIAGALITWIGFSEG